ncbi:MAG: TSUP family transporter [Candidatus Latescibacteria bacterium]|nr:TSUP family transporter [Candidatus Latescibacterota bacterium]NIO55230.1 TSUP family transporter [Candidatus Latescibacterota bacterium]
MPDFILGSFVEIDWAAAAQVILLGFIGGTLSGFIGSGGAFFMTPGMMNLGVPGNIAVASNITHKFGKAMIGAKRHGEMGHVDKKLAIFMLITAAAGISLAAWLMKLAGVAGGKGEEKGAGANLYISLIFVFVLSFVSISMLRDIIRSRGAEEVKPSRRIVDFLSRLHLYPLINFSVADVKVSLWIVLICGLATGYLAGTIGVGGFIGVPAMIYLFGVSSQVAAGTELFLAQFMGAWGALNYGLRGMVDIRLTLLLFIGSLIGIHMGAYGTKVVREVVIRLATSCIILLCVISRAVNIPAYLRQLGYIEFDPSKDAIFNSLSKGLLFASGITGALIILFFVFKAYIQRRKVHASLIASKEPAAPL